MVLNGAALAGRAPPATANWNTSWCAFLARVVDVNLNAGNNTIRFANSAAYAPDIDRIQIAARQ